MKKLIKENKSVIKFLAVFLISYTLLSVLYSFYLKFSATPDVFTKLVAKQTIQSLNFVGYETNSTTNQSNGFINLFIKGKNIAGIAEGCNAISIMILFIAFILAFVKDFKTTILFGLFGILFLHLMNIIRIVILTICIYHYPEYSDILHSIVFPAMIYGTVFLLWMYWVKSFQKAT